MTLDEIFNEASRRGITAMSITDHDSIDCQDAAVELANDFSIAYVIGLELNVSFSIPEYKDGKPVSLDFLAYDFDVHHQPLVEKLRALREHRRQRAERILGNLNREFAGEGKPAFTEKDMETIEESVDGAFGRPHIANYMVKKGVVSTRQEAFDRYLVKCNEPKMPVSLNEAAELIHGAGGKVVLAHANDPNGTSLVKITTSLAEQQEIIRTKMLEHIDGVECWHSRHDPKTTESYLAFAKQEGLIITGGSDCHQQPIIMGSLDIPKEVVEQFGIHLEGSV
jgi:predicted metal-dependent phosphoesterase TrpH